jgi:hypothetical protein
VILKPAEPPISPWPIITPEARDGWDALQRELATGYAGDSALLGRWFIDSWERTFQTTAPEWVTRTVPVIAPREPAPVAAAPEPAGDPAQPDEDVSPQPEAAEPAPDATQVLTDEPLLPPVEAPTAAAGAVQDEEADHG